MSRRDSDYADPFFGSGISQPPGGGRLASTWFFLKPQVGNTSPAACVPFGMVSAGAYSGAYPTGYGAFDLNFVAVPPRLHDRLLAAGFTHFHVNGTGAIEHYYNYFRVIPSAESAVPAWRLWDLDDEVARPGYYAASLPQAGIRAELAVSQKAALHRYTFSGGGSARLAIDFASASLRGANVAPRPPLESEVRLLGPAIVQGWVKMRGITIYLHAEVEGAQASSLWVDGREQPGEALAFGVGEPCPQCFGVSFETCQQAVVRLGFSLRSCSQARENMEPMIGASLEEIAARAAEEWHRIFDLIQVSGGTEREREIFYSSMYHTFVKPIDAVNESPFFTSPSDCWLDLATLWDQYKTQLPLVFSLLPECGASIIRSLLAFGETLGWFPNALLLSDDWSCCRMQARALAHYVIADGFYRHLPGVDWKYAIDLMVRDLRREANSDFLATGEAHPATHTLDLAGACHALAAMAAALGNPALAREMRDLSANWRTVFDPATARLKPSTYYEGGAWNYSFRLLPDMAARIALYPSEQHFVADLERFFGFGADPVVQPSDPKDPAHADSGLGLNRFQGLNNEPDMEVPYAFIYAGRHDRTAEIVREIMRCQFSTGPGALPGNNDSGGLTSWFIWSASGLFPVAGQPLILIGSPIFDSVTWHLGGNRLTIRAENNSPENIYVRNASWNGSVLDRAWLTMDELCGGGELVLRMDSTPSDWARDQRPGCSLHANTSLA